MPNTKDLHIILYKIHEYIKFHFSACPSALKRSALRNFILLRRLNEEIFVGLLSLNTSQQDITNIMRQNRISLPR